MSPWKMESQFTAALSAPDHFGKIRAVLVSADPLQVALGRDWERKLNTTEQIYLVLKQQILQRIRETSGMEVDLLTLAKLRRSASET